MILYSKNFKRVGELPEISLHSVAALWGKHEFQDSASVHIVPISQASFSETTAALQTKAVFKNNHEYPNLKIIVVLKMESTK